jgi:general stress protein YciG
MSGTIEGAKKAAIVNMALHGKDFYARIGRKGGCAISDKKKGFAADPERARWAGSIGGKKSKRGPAKRNKNA